jgi:methyl-accepting chemotaxis protein
MKSIRAKILLSFSIINFLVIIVCGFNFYFSSKMSNNTDEIVSNKLELLIANEKLTNNISKRIADARGLLLYNDQKFLESFTTLTNESESLHETLLRLDSSKQTARLVAQSKEWSELIINKVFNSYEKRDQFSARVTLRNEAQPLAEELITGFSKLTTDYEKDMIDSSQNIVANGDWTMMLNILISVLVIVIGIILSFFLARNISKPVKVVADRMTVMEDGDMSHEYLQISSQDEIGHLAKKMNDLQFGLRDVVQKVWATTQEVANKSEYLTRSAHEVKEGSEQIATTMEELSYGAESQVNSTSSVSNAMEQFMSTVQQANSYGEEVAVTSNEVFEMTKEGSLLMQQSVKQMGNIDLIFNESVERVKGLDNHSQEISKLVEVIKDIAEQTNLLSLNAAIEAARAGEHGKGFAVVAEEVRKLSDEVSHSVSDITTIVENIQTESNTVVSSLQKGYREVGEGSKQLQTTGETFEKITQSVTSMVQSIQNISNSLNNIEKSSDVINHSIEEIASVSEEAAAGIEQAAASAQQSTSSMEEVSKSAEDLAKYAEQLTVQVKRFTL